MEYVMFDVSIVINLTVKCNHGYDKLAEKIQSNKIFQLIYLISKSHN